MDKLSSKQQTINDMANAFGMLNESMAKFADQLSPYAATICRIGTELRREILHRNLLRWFPGWVAGFIAGHCPVRWLPSVDLEKLRK